MAEFSNNRKLGNRSTEFVSVKDFGAVGDGVTNDTSAFNSAVNSFGTQGGDVIVPPGKYLMFGNFGFDNSNVNLIGIGRPELYQSHTSSYVVMSLGNETDNVRISGFLFTAQGTWNATRNGTSVIDTNASSLSPGNDNIIIEDCIFDDTNVICPVTADKASNLTVRDCVMDVTNSEHAIYIIGDGSGGESNFRVYNNIITGPGNGTGGIIYRNCVNGWIYNNRVDSAITGISIDNTSTNTVKNIHIYDNIITNSKSTASSAAIAETAGTYASGVFIHDNQIDGMLNDCITGSCSETRISRNQIRNIGTSGKYGITHGGSGAADNLVITENVIMDVTSTTGRGIRFTGGWGDNTVIDGNVLIADGTGAHGISAGSNGSDSLKVGRNNVFIGFPAPLFGLSTGLFETFTDNDTTPDVSGGATRFKTANTVSTTITGFDSGYEGQQITVKITDANTVFDFTSSNLQGNGGVDFTAASGDSLLFEYDGSKWSAWISDS